MRPLSRPLAGTMLNAGREVLIEYNPYTKAKDILEECFGTYCAYCERGGIKGDELQVEHIRPKSILSHLEFEWDNLLMSCQRCNGIDNKGDKEIDFVTTAFPTKDNTLAMFDYSGGYVMVRSTLNLNDYNRAEQLYDILGLGKHPTFNPQNLSSKDKRWQYRMEAYNLATKYKGKLINDGSFHIDSILDLAKAIGYFSVWYQVFEDVDAVRRRLVLEFAGTNLAHFDAQFGVIP